MATMVCGIDFYSMCVCTKLCVVFISIRRLCAIDCTENDVLANCCSITTLTSSTYSRSTTIEKVDSIETHIRTTGWQQIWPYRVQVYVEIACSGGIYPREVFNDDGAISRNHHTNRGQGQNNGVFRGVSGPLFRSLSLPPSNQSNCASYTVWVYTILPKCVSYCR